MNKKITHMITTRAMLLPPRMTAMTMHTVKKMPNHASSITMKMPALRLTAKKL